MDELWVEYLRILARRWISRGYSGDEKLINRLNEYENDKKSCEERGRFQWMWLKLDIRLELMLTSMVLDFSINQLHVSINN